MSYSPEFKGPIEGYVVNYINANFWRVESTNERDDLMQDAYVVFMRCASRYPNMDTPQHFMALFKTSWCRHFINLSHADTEARAITPMMGTRVDGVDQEPVGEHESDGPLAVMLHQAPREVTAVLRLFLNAPQELLELTLGTWTGQDKRRRAGGSERINQLLGLPKNADTLQAVYDYFH